MYCDKPVGQNANLYNKSHEEEVCLAVAQLHMDTVFEFDDIIQNQFSTGEVLKAISGLKYRKKGGPDGLTNEHLKYGGLSLAASLARLFNAMYETEFVPSSMKKSFIYTLYKGTRKYDDDRKNYRGISLLPVITKLFERLPSF